MAEDKSKVYVSVHMPRELYERLNEMRWQTRARSMVGLVRDLLEDCANQYDKKSEGEAELVS